jgi:potassium efflux system protein
VNREAHRARVTCIHLASLILAMLLLASLPVSGQEFSLSGISADGSASAEQLESAIKAVEAREGLEDETRSKVIEQLRDAQAQIQNQLAAEAAAAAFIATLDSAPAETATLRATIDEETPDSPTASDFAITGSTQLEELEQLLTKELADMAAVDARLAEMETRIENQESRPAAARERINELRTAREELTAALSMPLASGEPPLLADARKLATELRRAAQGTEINKLEQELLSHSVRLNLLKAQRDAAARSRVQVQRRTELLRSIVNEKRQATAMLSQQAAVAAELAAADKHPSVRALAEVNADLTRQLPDVAADIERVTSELSAINDQAKSIEQRLSRSKQRLEIGGVSRSIGLLLVEERRSLPKVSQYRSQVRQRRSTLAEIGLAQVRIQEQRRELTPLDARVEEVMTDVQADVTDEQELGLIRSEVRLLLRDRRELLVQADNNYSRYLQVLGDLDVAQRRLLDSASEYQDFLGENLLWIPSAPIAFMGDWQDLGPAAAQALSPTLWSATITGLAASLAYHPEEAVFSLLLLAALLATRWPLAKRYKTMSGMVGRLATDSIGLTFASLAIAVVRALPLSLLLVMLGWFLSAAPQVSPFSMAVSTSLFTVAPFLYNVLLFRVLSASNGVLRVHFGWSEDILKGIRRQLDRLAAIAAPLVFATVFFFSSDVAADRATMGRLVFVALMVVLSWTFRPLAHPVSGVAATYYKRHPDAHGSRLQRLWYVLAMGVPLLLALISILGYLYTSLILTGRLVDTIWLILSLVVVNLVVLRWLALARRKLALRIAQSEHEAQQAAREKVSKADVDDEAPIAAAKPLDLDEVDQQTRKLLRAGLIFVAILGGWAIWADLFPAFSLLDKVALWSQTILVDGVETIAPVTLADVFLAVIVAAITAIASKNLPGLMEIAVLQRLTLQPGSRYAINTLMRYVVVTVGTISVLNTIGWNWSQIQWLVAALSVGLGFGLQEIVANFVSGLIILFERPVRVGDTVTVGQLSGTVSRVRIRATTITDWDRKEIIVPNKAFITEQVVNWTLSDPITRVVIPVGISYGSDVELAHSVMADTLASLPLVLDEPPPKVSFVGFGDSSLDFKLHVFSKQLTDRLPLTHAVHDAILKALRENGIEIPFPQRDLHIRSTVEHKSE